MMLKEEIREYVFSKPPTIANLKSFCLKIYDEFCRSASTQFKTKLKFYAFPSRVNASVQIDPRGKKATIFCNLSNVMNRNLSAGLQYFHLCTSVLHEIEHFKLFSNMYSSQSKDNPLSMALCEQITNVTDGFLARFVFSFICKWSRSYRTGIHMASSVELLCMERSHKLALDLFADVLSDDDFTKVSQLHQAISLMEQCSEINYIIPSWPMYKFAHIITNLQRRIAKKPSLLNKYPSLRSIFSPVGYLLSVKELSSKAVNESNSFYDQIILRIFFENHSELEQLLRCDKVLYDRIELIANQYCQLCVDFIRNKQLLLKWFDLSLVEDNAAMMIKNCKKLENRMTKLGMQKYAGSVFPLYLVR